MMTVYDKFRGLCAASGFLFKQKNTMYDGAFEKYGVLGVVCEIMGAAHRLPPMVMWTPDHGKSTKAQLVDIFTDLHNFANMALICLEKDNWDGRMK